MDSAGGRFQLVGNKLKVADATRLDYEQAHSHKIVVRATDLFGNSTDKSIKITVKDVKNEKIAGDAEANKLYGGSGKDTINGGFGNDTLKGGGAADAFVFNSALDALNNVDHIKDFKHDLDKFRLEKDIFHLTGSKLASGAFYDKADAHDTSDRILYEKSSGKLFYDADGNTAGGVDKVLFAVLDNHAKLDAGDFLLV